MYGSCSVTNIRMLCCRAIDTVVLIMVAPFGELSSKLFLAVTQFELFKIGGLSTFLVIFREPLHG